MARRQRQANSETSAFAWPGRDRSAELEQTARRAAERGLERIRARQLQVGAPLPPAPAPPERAHVIEMAQEAMVEPAHAAQEEPAAPPAVAAPEPVPRRAVEHARPAPDPWEAEFDDLADALIDQLRRDLGPAEGTQHSA